MQDRHHSARRGLPRLAAVGLLQIVLATAPGFADDAVDARAKAQLDALLRTSAAPSLTAAVARGGEIVWTYAAGLADRERAIAATPRTVYNVGSVSKAMTAVAVAKLIEQGRVRLDDPIQRYVPSFPDKGAPITLEHLVTHTSGIRHYRPHDFPGAPWAENDRPYRSVADAIAVFKDDRLLFPPGKFYFYTSYGVNLLQGVVEAASGQGFEQFLREQVWTPAGMTATSLDVAGRPVAGRARGYETRNGALVPTADVDVSYKYASGGMLSTAEDLARLGAALNYGKILGPAGTDALFRVHLPVVRTFHVDGPPTTEKFQMALLWRIVHRADGHDFVYECGTFNGFNACVLDYRAEDLVVSMIFNTFAGGYPPAEKLAALFRGR